MTIIKKKIGLGVLAAVSVTAIPIATAISCGKNKTEAPGTISSDFSMGMPLTWNILNATKETSVNVIMENSKKAKKLADAHGWNEVFTASATLLDEGDAKYGDQKEADSKRINKEMLAAIAKLSDVQKRSMVISATDIDVNDGDATKKYEFKIYTTINKESEMSKELQRFIGVFLKHSKSEAATYSEGEKLDKMKPLNDKLQDYAMKRYLSAQRSMRNFGDDGNSSYNGEAFYDNGFYTPDDYKKFTNEVFSYGNKKNPLAAVDELTNGKGMEHLDVSSVPTYNVQRGDFIQKITFYQGVQLENQKSDDGNWTMSVPGWTGSGNDLAGHTPEYKDYNQVFTINPIIQKFGDGTRFKAAGFNSLNDDQLVDYIGMIHEIMYNLGASGIVDGLKTLTNLLPTSTPFVLTNQEWCRALDQIRENSSSKEEAVKTIKDLARKNISKIREVITKKDTISEARLSYAYYRDHNKETSEAFHGESEHWEVHQDKEIETSEIVKKFNLTALDGANTQVLSMLFDYLNTMYSLGNTMTDMAWEAGLVE